MCWDDRTHTFNGDEGTAQREAREKDEAAVDKSKIDEEMAKARSDFIKE